MKAWCYKWLPIIFGCHCRDDRSFHWKGTRFPVCARCTGELIGMIFASLLAFFYIPPAWIAAVLMLPMIADGFIQLWTRYESTNFRRVTSGALFGYGFWTLFILSSILAVRFGYNLTQ